MFVYRPVDVTSHLTVFISVFRRHKCCASRNNAFYMFLCLNSTSCIYYQLFASWCSSDDNTFWVVDVEQLLLHSLFLPSYMSCITTSGIFLCLLTVFQGSGRIVRKLFALEFFCRLIISAGLKVDSWYFGRQFPVSCISALLDSLLLQRVFGHPCVIFLH
jgi:hypothetical protein